MDHTQIDEVHRYCIALVDAAVKFCIELSHHLYHEPAEQIRWTSEFQRNELPTVPIEEVMDHFASSPIEETGSAAFRSAHEFVLRGLATRMASEIHEGSMPRMLQHAANLRILLLAEYLKQRQSPISGAAETPTESRQNADKKEESTLRKRSADKRLMAALEQWKKHCLREGRRIGFEGFLRDFIRTKKDKTPKPKIWANSSPSGISRQLNDHPALRDLFVKQIDEALALRR